MHLAVQEVRIRTGALMVARLGAEHREDMHRQPALGLALILALALALTLALALILALALSLSLSLILSLTLTCTGCCITRCAPSRHSWASDPYPNPNPNPNLYPNPHLNPNQAQLGVAPYARKLLASRTVTTAHSFSA